MFFGGKDTLFFLNLGFKNNEKTQIEEDIKKYLNEYSFIIRSIYMANYFPQAKLSDLFFIEILVYNKLK
jgi:hypothetical protein